MPETHLEQKMFIPGPVGRLEAQISGIPMASGPTSDLSISLDVGIICHPHPLYQGTMDNKVVTTIARAFRTLGLATVRFNFRGVGDSEGVYDNGLGEVDDCLAVIEWIQQTMPNAKVWLAGFSFGGMIAVKAAYLKPVHRLITVAPAVSPFDSPSSVPKCPWLIIHGEQDEVVPIDTVKAWYQNFQSGLKSSGEIAWNATTSLEALDKAQNTYERPSIELVTFPDATHFFHGCLNELKTAIEQWSEAHE